MSRILTILTVSVLLQACSGPETNSPESAHFSHMDMTCVFFFIPDCPASKVDMPVIMDLKEKYEEFGFHVKAILADPEPDDSVLNAAIRQFNFTIPIVFDTLLLEARSIGATTTPEVFLFDSHNKLAYSGQVTDYYYSYGKHKNHMEKNYLEDAIIGLLTGTRIEVSRSEPIGCKINFDSFD